jgi:hypothetical protein
MVVAPGLFRPRGDFYTTIPDILFELYTILPELLPKEEVNASINATFRVMGFLVKMARADALNELVTDRLIAAETGVSQRNVQRALYVLDVVLRKIGKPIIDRLRIHGRRIISFVRGFAARGSLASPQTPLKTSETTTTSDPSSSSASSPENPQGPKVILPPGLVDRAMRLILQATEGRVIDAVAVYGVDWVNQALDVVEKRTKNRDNLRVKSWGFVLRILSNWKREGGPPPVDPPPVPAAARAAKAEPAQEESPYRLTAEEVAELVRKCQSSHPSDLPVLARVQLRQAVAEGGIDAELLSTIPAELKEATKPRAP